MPSGSVVRSLQHRAGDRVGDDQRRRRQEFALRFGWMRASKLRLPDSTAAQTRSFCTIASFDRSGEQVAGVADAGRAAVGRDVEAELFEVGQQAGLRQVLGDHARAGRERRLDVRLDRQPLLDGLLREQARGEQHARDSTCSCTT